MAKMKQMVLEDLLSNPKNGRPIIYFVAQTKGWLETSENSPMDAQFD